MKLNRITLGMGLAAVCACCYVSAEPLYNVVVAADGSGDYSSVQEALNHAPNDNSEYVVYIRDGIYNEKVEVTRPNVYLIGQDRDKTIIRAATANGMLKVDGKKFGTFGSRTFSVNAKNFKARSLTIENSFDYPANAKKADSDPSKIHGSQAVALLISNHGDDAQFKDVNLVGYQDTLYLRAGHSYFDRSTISGNIDFIFGLGTALIDNSTIVARQRTGAKPGERYGYITAPATDIKVPYGIVFKHSHLTKERGVPAGSYGLGRPWHPTTTFPDGRYADPNAIGNTAYIDCVMDDHIAGWDKMSGHDINNKTIWFYPEQSRFYEYHSTGKGASVSAKRPQLTAAQAKQYTDTAILSGWVPDISLGKDSVLKGEVLNNAMHFPAEVTVKDSLGKVIRLTTDAKGRYHTSIAGMTAPLIVSADDHSGRSCLMTRHGRSVCEAAVVVDVNNNGITYGNVNPFSDLITSVLAQHEGLLGPQQLVEQKRVPAMSFSEWQRANRHFHQAFDGMLSQYGVEKDTVWDPVNYSATFHPMMVTLARQVLQNRGYDTQTGQAKDTLLADLSFRPITGLGTNPVYYLSHNQLAETQHELATAKTRIFLIGDSTASYYEPEAFPRTGWGQAFHALVRNDKNIMFIDAARSGRSSRDYVNGLWFKLLAPRVKPGDYLFIQFSHNDEKCDSSKPGRGPIDVANLCTYPNDAKGRPQFPKGHPEMSLQHSLEHYLAFAQKHHLHPVILTPLPRAVTAQNKLGTPLAKVQHVTKQNRRHGFAFVGNYTETVKQTAKRHDVPLLDIQKDVIKLADQASDWRTMWLAINPDKYPYYKNRSGNLSKPDSTHFQLRGANMVAKAVLNEIKHEPELHNLAVQL